MTPGTFILSLDLELAWGTFDHGGLERHGASLRAERRIVRDLLRTLDRLQIPATWATVGHLLLDRCERVDGSCHPDVLAPRYDWYRGDWHGMDPGTDVARDPLWYGSDVVAEIMASRTPQELGTHTFSHVVVGDPACSAEIFRSQLRKCAELHGLVGQPLRSIVYPRNQIGHLDVLSEFGIIAYRGPEERWYRELPGRARRACHLADRLLALEPPTYALGDRVRGNGIVDLPASMFLMPGDGPRRLIPAYSRRLQARRGLDRAAARGELFHLWFHPFNLASDPRLPAVITDILEDVARRADRGQIVPTTMGALAQRLLN